MSIIQTIRDKAAPVVIILIGISLLGFIAMDAFVGKTSGLFSSQSNAGTINGKTLEFSELNAANDYQEAFAKAIGQKGLDEETKNRNTEQMWQIASYYEAVKKETDKLGITITDAELNEAIKNPAQPPPFVQGLLGSPKDNPEYQNQINDFCKNRYKFLNGLIKRQLDAYKAQGYKTNDQNGEPEPIKEFRKAFSPSLFEKANIEPLRKTLLIQKYMAIMGKATYVPEWMATAVSNQSAQLANAQYVYAPYSSISDSTLTKITDDEINKYVATHKDLYRADPSKQINYVTFNAQASATDTAALLAKMEAKRNDFNTTTKADIFVAQAGSTVQYEDEFKTKKELGYAKIDSMVAKGLNVVGGPFIEKNAFYYTKVLASVAIPDSVKARHILLSVKRGEDTTASYAKADTLFKQIKSGASFDSLAKQNSDDPGSKEKFGDLGFFAKGNMVPEFDEFCFFNKVGDKKIVRSQFGYHIIEITGNKGQANAYKMAVYAQDIRPSDATTNMALNEANKFSSANRTTAAFNEAAKNSNGKINKLQATIKAGENKLNNIPNSQAILREFLNKAKDGDVSNPIKVDDFYYVCNLVSSTTDGFMNASMARPAVERILLDKQKANKLMEKAKGATSLDDAAAKLTVTVAKADSVSFANNTIPGVGSEPKVVGAMFDKNNLSKLSAPIAGETGIYFIQTNSFGTKTLLGTVADTRKGLYNEANQGSFSLIEELKRKIKITDKRNSN